MVGSIKVRLRDPPPFFRFLTRISSEESRRTFNPDSANERSILDLHFVVFSKRLKNVFLSKITVEVGHFANLANF